MLTSPEPILSLPEIADTLLHKPSALSFIRIKPEGASVTRSYTPVHKLKYLHSHFLCLGYN